MIEQLQYREPSCGTCRFYGALVLGKDRHPALIGECHRYAPSRPAVNRTDSVFPTVVGGPSPDEDWCGEWEGKFPSPIPSASERATALPGYVTVEEYERSKPTAPPAIPEWSPHGGPF